MSTAFRTAGYSPKVLDLPSSGGERRIFGTIREILRPTMKIPWLYRFNKRIERRLLPKMMKPLSQEAEVILTFGEPEDAGSLPK